MHIYISKLTIVGSDNGLSPGRRQAIIWTNAGILLIWTLGTNFSEISSEIHEFSFNKMHLKMSSAKWRLYCLGFNVLNRHGHTMPDFSGHLYGRGWVGGWPLIFIYWFCTLHTWMMIPHPSCWQPPIHRQTLCKVAVFPFNDLCFG